MGDIDLKSSEVLDAAVSEDVIARDEQGVMYVEDELTEDGLTDFPYVCDDQTGVEMMNIGIEVASAAAGREIWYTHDGVGIRLFFGVLDEVLTRVSRKNAELVRNQIANKAVENPKYSRTDLCQLVFKATGRTVPGDRDDVLEDLDVDELRKVLRQMFTVD